MKLSFTISLRSDYHVGAGYGRGSKVDSILLRDGDGVPVLRGSTIVGLLRDALWRLLQTPLMLQVGKAPGHGPFEHCQADDICPVCAVFGSPAHKKPWRFSSARPEGAQAPSMERGVWRQGDIESQDITRVSINQRTRRADRGKLFSQEEGTKAHRFSFTVGCLENRPGALREAALLVAAARMIRRLGSARRRGRGECIISLTEVEGWPDKPPQDGDWQAHMLDRFEGVLSENGTDDVSIAPAVWKSPTASDSKPRGFRLLVRLDEPLVCSSHAEAGNVFDSTSVVQGATVLGALAHLAASKWDLETDSHIYSEFLDVFRRGGVGFSPLYPVYYKLPSDLYPSIPAPLDMLVCKAHPKLGTAHGPHMSHASASEPHSDCQECQCNIPLVHVGGFVPIREGVPSFETAYREEMHPRINPETNRVSTGGLYSYVALESGQHFMGEIWCRDDRAWQVLTQLTGVQKEGEPFSLRMGKSVGRGYGATICSLHSLSDGVDLWRGQPVANRVASEKEPITLTLLSDAILPDTWGRFRQVLDKAWLEDLLELELVEESVRAFCKATTLDGFNNKLGLPRWRDIAIRAGSSVGFTLKTVVSLAQLHKRLQQVESAGIGIRRHEGFGMLAFNHPVYRNGDGVSGTGLSVHSLPESMRTTNGEATGLAGQIQMNLQRIRDWQQDLQDGAKLPEKLFRRSEWDSVARWLWINAGGSVEELQEGLDELGKSEWLTDVPREAQGHFSEGKAREAVVQLKRCVKEAADQEDVSRQIVLQMLANHISALARSEGDK